MEICLEVLRDKRDCVLHEHALLTLFYISNNEKQAGKVAEHGVFNLLSDISSELLPQGVR